ncbi:hypothetical protein OROMI_022550 [Orobanche minor]
MPMPQVNPFAQFTPLNLHLQRTLPFNPVLSQLYSQQQQFGSAFSFQGLMNASSNPNGSQTFDSPTGNQTFYSPVTFDPSIVDQTESSKRTKKKGKKAKKSQTSEAAQPPVLRRWTTEEDIALTKAYLYISLDADVGTSQKKGSLWNRVLQVWRDNMVVYDATRNSNSLGCHWGTISSAVTKFHGFWEQLERNPQSGSTPEDMKKQAHRMYKEVGDQPFRYEHCWEIMKNNPKWCTQQLTKSGISKKQKLADGSFVDNSLPHGDNAINLDTEINNNSNGVTRPDGRKATKEMKKRAVIEKGVIDVLGNLQCTLERQFDFNREELELKKEKDKRDSELREQVIKMELEFKERNQKMKEKAQKRKEQERILNKDLTNLQPAVRETFERMQAKILKEWENDTLFSEVESENVEI